MPWVDGGTRRALINLPGTATRLTVPPECLVPGAQNDFEVLAIEASGNSTISVGEFVTAGLHAVSLSADSVCGNANVHVTEPALGTFTLPFSFDVEPGQHFSRQVYTNDVLRCTFRRWAQSGHRVHDLLEILERQYCR